MEPTGRTPPDLPSSSPGPDRPTGRWEPGVRTRFALVGGGLMLLFCATLLGLRELERRKVAGLVAEAQRDASRQVERLLALDGFAVRQLVQELAQGGLGSRIGREPEAGLRELAVAHGADAVWLVDATGQVERGVSAAGAAPAPPLPVAAAAAPGSRRFFAEDAEGLVELLGAPRPTSEGGGWVLAARRWNDVRLAALVRNLECEVDLLPGNAVVAPVAATEGFQVVVPLTGPRGEPVRLLRAVRRDSGIPQALHSDATLVRLFVVFGGLLLVALGWAVHRWVLRPLDRLGASLAREDAAPLQDLAAGPEFARLARLAQDSFTRNAALRREIEERQRAERELEAAQENLRQSIEVRTRLARNLHDTVIQSIYATGLGLESARGEITADPAAAAARLAHCRANLNDAIREVRGFINDLEPESLRRQPFAQALRSLAFTMQSLWVANITVELDEPLAARFTPAQETHVLQIVREGISNALRHGEATRVLIRLQADGDGRNLLVKVQDNGRGFDAARRAGTGRGLVNMTSRAQELGGSLRLQTAPGEGTTLVLRLPLLPRP